MNPSNRTAGTRLRIIIAAVMVSLAAALGAAGSAGAAVNMTSYPSFDCYQQTTLLPASITMHEPKMANDGLLTGYGATLERWNSATGQWYAYGRGGQVWFADTAYGQLDAKQYKWNVAPHSYYRINFSILQYNPVTKSAPPTASFYVQAIYGAVGSYPTASYCAT
jgi:hypothetical protein